MPIIHSYSNHQTSLTVLALTTYEWFAFLIFSSGITFCPLAYDSFVQSFIPFCSQPFSPECHIDFHTSGRYLIIIVNYFGKSAPQVGGYQLLSALAHSQLNIGSLGMPLV